MDFPYGGDPMYRVSLLDKNDAVPSPRVVKLAVAVLVLLLLLFTKSSLVSYNLYHSS